jgi:CelD/BcsL family acetyltransferase involved in cellulose biosynthesis
MEFLYHTNFPSNLHKEWDTLLDQSINDVPFLRYDYLETWWRTRGGGEWPNEAEIAILSANRNNVLVGIAPFFFYKQNEKTTLYFLGSLEICDYLDFVVKPEEVESFIHELMNFITSPAFPHWDQMILHNMLQTSPAMTALEKAAKQHAFRFTAECEKQSPFISLPGNWEDYLSSIDKKQRHEIRRKMRRAEENTDLSWYVAEKETLLNEEIDAFLQLMSLDPEKTKFLTAPMREQMRLTMQWAFKENYLQLSFLEIHKQKAAAYFCFNYKNKILVYNSGFDPGFSEYSPGWVLLGNLLRWSNENKIAEFDFMRGNEEYKYHFGARDRFVICTIIERK